MCFGKGTAYTSPFLIVPFVFLQCLSVKEEGKEEVVGVFLKLVSPLQHRGFTGKMKHRKRYSDSSQRHFVLHLAMLYISKIKNLKAFGVNSKSCY